MEGEIHDLVVEGEIPRELHGTLYRNGPNQQYAPRDAYHPFSGDGMIHAFHIEGGRAAYRNRWVRTPRFELERAAGEALFASFANPQANDPRTQDVPGGPANTNVVWHAGKLLALVEGGLPPVRLDPDSLATLGIDDFGGRLRRRIEPETARALGIDAPDGTVPGTFTAHPKLDPETGEMLGFGYSALPPYLQYYVVSPAGELVRSLEIEIPFPAMIHDFVTTREHVIFPIFPATLRAERMAQGKSVLGWEPGLGTHVGVMPRDGSSADVRWFQTSASFVFHPLNAYTDGRRVVADMAQYPRLPIPADGNDGLFDRAVNARLVRWTIDLDGGVLKEEPLDDLPVEFPRLDERRSGLAHRHGYAASGETIVGGFQKLVRWDFSTGRRSDHDLGAGSASSEPIFVPRRPAAPEGEGFLLAVVHRAQERRSDLVILDAENLAQAPLATVKLPHPVPLGFHGNWRELG
jgi:carotenoid cleavage dioxygenase